MLQCQCDGLRTTEVRCCALRSDFMNEIVKLFVKASLEWESEVQCLSYLGDAGNYSKYAVLRLLRTSEFLNSTSQQEQNSNN